MPERVSIDAVLTGAARTIGSAGGAPVVSAIGKLVRHGALRLTSAGLEGDEQGDRIYHGGPDKALHHYAAEHYAYWRARFPDAPLALQAGAFGENLSSTGMGEHDVHVGDVFALGTALLQVTQARQPCFKLNLRLGRADASLAMQASGRTGWYYRVLREGWIAAGQCIELVERPHPGWPLARLIAALYPSACAGCADAIDPAASWLRDEWAAAAALPELAPRWRQAFERRLHSGRIEDWRLRLYGPDAAPR